MSQGESPLILSEWYELVAGDQLMQGDIFEDCPVFRPPSDLKWPIQEESEEFEFALGTQDVMVMTQSCDLLPDQKSGMWLVVVLQPGEHGLAGPCFMVFTNCQSEGRVNPQRIGVVAIFIACSHLINPLTHHLDQGMFRMGR